MTTSSPRRPWRGSPGSGSSTRATCSGGSSSGTPWRRAPTTCGAWRATRASGRPTSAYDPATGTFYLTYSVMRSTAARYFDVDNYVVTAPTIEGPWSAPAYLNSVGFDPSLLHDDGRAALAGGAGVGPAGRLRAPRRHRPRRVRPAAEAAWSGSPAGSTGAAPTAAASRPPTCTGTTAWYYLMAAEGGTGYAHGVTLARSATIEGPYEPDPLNPFLTSNPASIPGRDDPDHLKPEWFNPDAELQKAGHGSLVSTPDGEWYVAHLCARPIGPDHRCTLGRETALQQVRWSDDGWLRLSTGGTVAGLETPSPAGATPSAVAPDIVRRTDFAGPDLDLWFSTLRRPASDGLAEGGERRAGPSAAWRRVRDVPPRELGGRHPAAGLRGLGRDPRRRGTAALLAVGGAGRHLRRAQPPLRPGLRQREPGCPGRCGALGEVGREDRAPRHRQPLPDGPIVLGADLDVGVVRFWWAPADEPETARRWGRRSTRPSCQTRASTASAAPWSGSPASTGTAATSRPPSTTSSCATPSRNPTAPVRTNHQE